MSNTKAIKILVENNEHGEIIQNTLFSLGYRWYTSGDEVLKLDNGSYILTSCEGVMSYSIGDAANHYDEYIFQKMANSNFQRREDGKYSNWNTRSTTSQRQSRWKRNSILDIEGVRKNNRGVSQ